MTAETGRRWDVVPLDWLLPFCHWLSFKWTSSCFLTIIRCFLGYCKCLIYIYKWVMDFFKQFVNTINDDEFWELTNFFKKNITHIGIHLLIPQSRGILLWLMHQIHKNKATEEGKKCFCPTKPLKTTKFLVRSFYYDGWKTFI